MGITAGFVNFVAFKRQLSKLDENIQQAAVKQIRTEVRRLAVDMPPRAASFGRIAARAGRTVSMREDGAGATVKGGGGGGLGGIVFAGAEYGGQRRRKTYASMVRRTGTVFVVHRRHTTMQFHPHLGSRGYFFWPTIRQDLHGVRSRMNEAIERGSWRG